MQQSKFFFIHIMKTGGTSFSHVIADNFEEAHRYPYAKDDAVFFERMESYVHVPKFIQSVNSNSQNLQVISAHVPLATRDFLIEPYRTLTLLREPVERTISYLKHCRRYHIEHQNMSLEDIYADDWFRATFMENYQTKIFSMTAAEALAEDRLKDHYPTMPPRDQINLETEFTGKLAEFKDEAPGRFCMEFFAPSTGVIVVDDARFESAKESLRQLDVVGVTAEFDRFLKRLSEKFDWTIREFPKQHVGEPDNVSQALREKIAADNEFDRELFLYARSLI